MHLDFKFEVSDPAKISRSLASFANTEGGKLLIGVNDDGRISGIRSEEEYHMLKTAAEKYCSPIVIFSSREWNLNGKKVLEITIPKSTNDPHRAPDHNDKLKAYVRINDQNILANGVQMKIWQKRNANKDVSFVYSEDARQLLSLLQQYNSLSISHIIPLVNLSRYMIENILAELILMKVVVMIVNETGAIFSLTDPFEEE